MPNGPKVCEVGLFLGELPYSGAQAVCVDFSSFFVRFSLEALLREMESHRANRSGRFDKTIFAFRTPKIRNKK